MAKEIINITDITGYLYCPRKVYLQRVKGMKAPPNQRMINGMLRHKVFDIFNKNESVLISSINEKIERKQIEKMYQELGLKVTSEVIGLDQNLMSKFNIHPFDFSKSVNDSLQPEIKLRVEPVIKTMDLGFLGKELWRNLSPKYLTELKIDSLDLGLRGRIDRVRFQEELTPFEVKTRERVFESDKVQLAGYALLLESEFHKPVKKGVVEIMGQVQEIEITDELKQQVIDIAEKIRNLKEDNASMPSSFNKCQNCEYKENCI